jgi:hypothetical protein
MVLTGYTGTGVDTEYLFLFDIPTVIALGAQAHGPHLASTANCIGPA